MNNKLQNEVTKWVEDTFGKSTSPRGKILHLFEELEEVFNECENDKQKEEVSDVAMITLHLGSFLNVEIPQVSQEFENHIRRKFEICKQRKWERRENGLIKHIKGETNG